MKTWQKIFLVAVGVGLVAAAGFLGFRGEMPGETKALLERLNLPSGAQANPAPTPLPPTVEAERGNVTKTIITPGQVINTNTINLPAETSGIVRQVTVQPGDHVKKGDLLVEIGLRDQLTATVSAARLALLDAQQTLDALVNDAPLKAALAQQALVDARQEVAAAEYRVNSLGVPASSASLASAQADLALLQQRLSNAEAAYAPYKDTPDGDIDKALAQSEWAGAKQAYDDALRRLNYLTGTPNELTRARLEADLAVARAKLTLAEGAFARLENGIDPAEYARAQARRENAAFDLALAESELDRNLITAPFDGVIIEVAARPGDSTTAGSPLIRIADPLAIEVLTSVVEQDYPLVQVGQKVDLYFDARPDVVGSGKVIRIIPRRSSSDRVLYQVYVSLDSIPGSIVDGMTADTSIVIAEKVGVVRVPRSLVKARPDGTAQLDVLRAGRVVTVTVTVGLRGDLYTEIVSGLEPGDQVVSK